MRRFTVLCFVLLMFGAFAAAQLEPVQIVPPNNELYLGYAYQYADTSGSNVVDHIQIADIKSTNLNGFNFQFSRYLKNKKLGLTVDVARGSNSHVDSTGIKDVRVSYMAGPTYRIHQIGFVTFNVHALAGVDHEKFTVPMTSTTLFPTDTALALAGGVTVDGNLSKHLAVRLGQADLVYTEHYSSNQASFRYTGGVVVRF